MKLRRRKGLGSGRGARDGGHSAERDADRARGRDADRARGRAEAPDAGRAPFTWARLAAALRSAAHGLRTRPGRWLQTALVVLLSFGIGYVLSAAWILPESDASVPADLVHVPDVVGQTRAAAESRARERGLIVRVGAELHHPEEEVGVVLAQSPLPDGMAVRGDTLRLTMSLGPRSVEVPDLRGFAEPQALAVLERLGFTVRSRSVQAASPGVQGTEPDAGARVTLPAEVEVRVGEGAKVVAVPDLRGMHIDDVERLLEQAGLQLGSLRHDPDAAQAPGRVVGQSPPPGYSLRGGGFVSVEVAGRPEGD